MIFLNKFLAQCNETFILPKHKIKQKSCFSPWIANNICLIIEKEPNFIQKVFKKG